MSTQMCDICGYQSYLGSVEQQRKIPREITHDAGVPDSELINICKNCYLELQTWYKMKITESEYNPEIQRFVAKSKEKLCKEYEDAFERFQKYKEDQRKIAEMQIKGELE